MALHKIEPQKLDEVINSPENPCIVVFSRPTCPVCEEVVPRVEALADRYTEKVSFYYVDVEEDKSVLKKFALKGVPQILFFSKGEFFGKLAGNVDEDTIEEKINELV